MKIMTCTLFFAIKGDEILLAKKKRGFGEGKYNGVGGKLEPGETIEQAMIRETYEEIGIKPTKYTKVAEIVFDEWVKGEQALLTMHTYLATDYEGTPTESEEMKPYWFKFDKIPYKEMFPDDTYWLPYVLRGEKVKANFKFDKDFNILNHKITVVEKL